MSKNDATLGFDVHDMLINAGLETPRDFSQGMNLTSPNGITTQERIRIQFHDIMKHLCLYLDDDSLKDTPHRVAKMFCEEIFYGLDYVNFPTCTTVKNKMGYEEMVACTASVKSVCEHHFVPFVGTAHVAYLPDDKVIGLSKINRIVDFFSRRPQIQERLTEQIAATLGYILQTDNVAVVIQAQHFCVHMRGVQDTQSRTTTSKMLGKFRTVPELRSEFLSLTRQ